MRSPPGQVHPTLGNDWVVRKDGWHNFKIQGLANTLLLSLFHRIDLKILWLEMPLTDPVVFGVDVCAHVNSDKSHPPEIIYIFLS